MSVQNSPPTDTNPSQMNASHSNIPYLFIIHFNITFTSILGSRKDFLSQVLRETFCTILHLLTVLFLGDHDIGPWPWRWRHYNPSKRLNHLPVDTASHPRRIQFSATPLCHNTESYSSDYNGSWDFSYADLGKSTAAANIFYNVRISVHSSHFSVECKTGKISLPNQKN